MSANVKVKAEIKYTVDLRFFEFGSRSGIFATALEQSSLFNVPILVFAMRFACLIFLLQSIANQGQQLPQLVVRFNISIHPPNNPMSLESRRRINSGCKTSNKR
jgi:hypothetical protein